MKELLYVDCCIRGDGSRTRKLAETFFAALPEGYHVTRLDLMKLALQPLCGARFQAREALIARGALDDPSFDRARQIAAADAVVIAAPFWDLSFPALLKLYFEDVSVQGITFRYTQQGSEGLCRAARCVYLTTRGGLYAQGDPLEQGTPYLAGIKALFGFGALECVAADGLDVQGLDAEAILKNACRDASELAKSM